jgi:hypothetical protein
MNPGSSPHSWLARVHMTPAPETVARLIETHGAEAAYDRWYSLDPRTVQSLAQKGRKALAA